jgi:hypothetical protein
MICAKGAAIRDRNQSELAMVVLADEGLFEARASRTSSDSPQATTFREFLTTLRSYAVGYWMGIQSLDIDEIAKSNIATFVCLGCHDPKEAREISGLLGLPAERWNLPLKLNQGQFLLRSICCDHPVMGTFPDFKAGPYLSDDDLARKMAPIWESLASQCVRAPAPYESRAPVDLTGIIEVAEESEGTLVVEDRSAYNSRQGQPL